MTRPTIPLPEKSVRLSTAGFKKLWESHSLDLPTRNRIADEIEARPRQTLDYVFKLTKTQKHAIASTSDDELRRRSQLLLIELRSAAPEEPKFVPNGQGKPPPQGQPILGCGCSFHPPRH